VLVEHLIEVPQAEKEQAVGVLGLDLQILLFHGGEFWHTNLSFCGNFGRGGEGLRFVREGSVRGRWVFCLAGGPSQNWGMAAAARALRAHWRLRRMLWPAEPVKT